MVAKGVFPTKGVVNPRCQTSSDYFHRSKHSFPSHKCDIVGEYLESREISYSLQISKVKRIGILMIKNILKLLKIIQLYKLFKLYHLKCNSLIKIKKCITLKLLKYFNITRLVYEFMPGWDPASLPQRGLTRTRPAMGREHRQLVNWPHPR